MNGKKKTPTTTVARPNSFKAFVYYHSVYCFWVYFFFRCCWCQAACLFHRLCYVILARTNNKQQATNYFRVFVVVVAFVQSVVSYGCYLFTTCLETEATTWLLTMVKYLLECNHKRRNKKKIAKNKRPEML